MPDSGFLALFLVGLLGGTHCIGMCGGILLAQGNALLYNGGRLLLNVTTVAAKAATAISKNSPPLPNGK